MSGQISPTDFFSTGLYRIDSKSAEVQDWLNAEAYDEAEAPALAPIENHAHHAANEDDPNRHGDRIKAYCVTREQPIAWARFSAWLDLISSMRGDDLLRVKGIVNIAEHPSRPMVIHGVQHIFHPPIQLDAWPSEDRRTRIVFITRDIDKDVIEDTLRVFERRVAKSRRSG